MTMETAEQPKRGRRYRITPEIQADILRWLENGMSIRSTCKALGVGERTFFTECKRNPTFLAATDRARERGKAKLILKLRRRSVPHSRKSVSSGSSLCLNFFTDGFR